MTGQQLKNSILQMAVQGRLVPQDPNDEPASVLLERIRKEKEQLIKDGKIKKEKNPSYIFRGADNLPYEKVGKSEPVSIAGEVPFEIPESWEWVRLKNICNVVSAKRVHQSDWKNEGVPFYRAREIGKLSEYGTVDNDLFISKELYQEFSKSGVPKAGDLMVTAVGTLGKTYIVQDNDRFYYKDASVICFENFSKLLPEYLQLVMMTPYMSSTIKEHSTGTTVGTITIITANQYLIPIPPIREQKRIIDKISELSSIAQVYSNKENELSTYNSYFPVQLKKSILQEAIRGKLVPQNPADEPADVLLERIRAEKERLIQEGKIKRDKHESVIYRRDNSHYEKRGSEEVCIDDEIPFEIPESWCWCRLSSFGIFSSGKTPSMQNPDYWNGTVPWVSSKDMKKPVINDSEMHITELAAETMQLYPAGTLLLVARSGILRRLLPLCILGVDSTINQDIKAFTLYDAKTSSWIYYAIKAFEPYILKELVKSVTTVESLKFDEFISMLIPIPPEKEQIRIIDALKDALSLLTPLSKNPLFSL